MSDPDEESGASEKPPAHGGPREHDETVVQILASKVLIDWLRNRQQLLVPLTLDLRKLAPAEAEMLMRAMATAARAGGVLEATDRQRLETAVQRLNASAEQLSRFAALVDERKSLAEVLADVPDTETGAKVYAASLLATDRRRRVNRYYLQYLAERLKLPRDLARSLEQRFNARL